MLSNIPSRTPHSFLIIAALLLANCWLVTARAQSTAPVNPERERALELYRQDKFSEAAKELRKVVDKDKRDAEAWHFLGLALLYHSKKIKDASRALETAVKLRPDYAPSRTAFAYTLLTRNKLSDAIREAQAALRIDPKIRDARYFLGAAYLRTGSRNEALEQAEIVVDLDPQFAGGYLLKSQALVLFVGDVLVNANYDTNAERRTRYAKAAEALEKYLQLAPNAKGNETWLEQLESLRFHSGSRRDGEPRAYASKDVTTRARVLSKPEPSYTGQARSNQTTGVIVFRAVLTAEGSVKHILVLSGLPDGLTEAAIRAARRIKFIPATIEGKPVSTFVQLEYHFNLY